MGKSYPMASRDELTDQIVSLRQRFPTYDAYADAVLEDILDSNQIRTAGYLQSNFLETVWFENTPQGFLEHRLPVQANFAPVHAIHIDDVDKDGFQDLVLFGNTDQVRIKIGKMDANYGLLLKGDGQGGFIAVGQNQSGFKLTGCVRDVIALPPVNGKRVIMVGRNNMDPVFYQY
jgi:hypothetical protein